MVENEQRLWERIGAALQSERRRISQAIASYPTPIAGCDQQFNYLLEQQAAIQAEWSRFETAQGTRRTAASGPRSLASEFLAECTALDASAKEHLLRPTRPADPE